MTTHSVRISTMGDLIALLPYQLGFNPTRSLVVVGLRGSRVCVTARVDLEAASEEGLSSLQNLCGALSRGGVDELFAIVIEDQEGEGETVADAFITVAETFALPVNELVYVRGSRWFPQWVASRRERTLGHPIPCAADVPAIATFVGLGSAPVSRREDLADLVQPRAVTSTMREKASEMLAGHYLRAAIQLRRRTPGEHERALTALGVPKAQRLEIIRAAGAREVTLTATGVPAVAGRARRASPLWQRLMAPDLSGPDPVWSEEDLLGLAVSLLDSDWRDGLLSWMCPGTLPIEVFSPGTQKALVRHLSGEHADSAIVVQRLCALVARLPDEGGCLTAGLCTLLASYAWHYGHSVIASAAVERAVRAEPDYRLAQLVAAMVSAGVPPASFADRDDDEGSPAISV